VTLASTVEAVEAGRIAIRDGVEPGERVVVAGVHALQQGQAVRLTDDAR
jgi:hypothetical protein